jgi:hypothetical protein
VQPPVVLPNLMCVCMLDVHRTRTVNLLDWTRSDETLAQEVIIEFILEKYHKTTANCAFVIWLNSNAAAPNTWAYSYSRKTFFFESLSPGAWGGGILAHELGHSLWGLGHPWCGLMFGYMPNPPPPHHQTWPWNTGCVTCQPYTDVEEDGTITTKPSDETTLNTFGVKVKPSRRCEPNAAVYFPGVTNPCARRGGPSGGTSHAPPHRPFRILHPGPCQINHAPCT